jgi:hypothetical protein
MMAMVPAAAAMHFGGIWEDMLLKNIVVELADEDDPMM